MSITLPNGSHLRYQDHQLHLEEVALHTLATTYATPLFVYSKAAMLEALGAYQAGFKGRKAQICYAM